MEQKLVMSNQLIQASGIRIAAAASSREEAVALCGQTLLELGAVSEEYIQAMWEREQIISSYMGEGVAMPHGTDESRKFVKFDQLVFLRFAEEIDWDGVPVIAFDMFLGDPAITKLIEDVKNGAEISDE